MATEYEDVEVTLSTTTRQSKDLFDDLLLLSDDDDLQTLFSANDLREFQRAQKSALQLFNDILEIKNKVDLIKKKIALQQQFKKPATKSTKAENLTKNDN